MELNKTPAIIALSIIGIIVIAAVAIPIITDVTEEQQKVAVNESGTYASLVSSIGSSKTIEIKPGTEPAITIEGHNYPITGGETPVLETKEIMIILFGDKDASILIREMGKNSVTVKELTTLTISKTNVAIHYGSTDNTVSITNGYYLDPNGKIAICKANTNEGTKIFINSQDNIKAMMHNNFGKLFWFDGTTNKTFLNGAESPDVKTYINPNVVPVSAGGTLKIIFASSNIEYSDIYLTTSGTDIQYTYIAVDKEINYTYGLDGPEKGIINVIPILLVISLLLGIIGYITVKKYQ